MTKLEAINRAIVALQNGLVTQRISYERDELSIRGGKSTLRGPGLGSGMDITPSLCLAKVIETLDGVAIGFKDYFSHLDWEVDVERALAQAARQRLTQDFETISERLKYGKFL